MDTIPFIPSDNNYTLQVPLGGVVYLFDVRWNARDLAWYFDLRNADQTPIVYGVKIVLGGQLAHWCRDPFFRENVLQVDDTSGAMRDAGYDDLGVRVVVLHTTMAEARGGLAQ